MVTALQRRIKVGRYFLDLVNRKIAGELSQDEFERRTGIIKAHPHPVPLPEGEGQSDNDKYIEQLQLGIGASTEGPENDGRSNRSHSN